MTVMASPKKRPGPGRPRKDEPAPRKGTPLHCWINEALREALDGFIDQSRPRGSLKDHIEIAIEEYLEKRGHWPPGESD
jgi:hypothetical protein